MNSVRLYSNGTAVIRREYALGDREPLRITIPVRKTDLDDVISSLCVFGDVTITEPPTYTPTNADAPALFLNPANPFSDLATKLAGASVEVDAGPTYAGTLIGRHSYRREANGVFHEQSRILVLTAKGVQQIEESSVTAIRFTDPAVRSEIDKSLRASLGRIRPDSSEVTLTLRGNPGATTAAVTYATPVAAWKIRYQLRLSPDGAELEGQAVVDNDTDDDWSETLITVIAGEPISFSTDLAEIRRPERDRVNLVADRTVGAVAAAPEMPERYFDSQMPNIVGASRGLGREMAMRSVALESDFSDAMVMQKAYQPQAEVRESGDFSVFTSPDPVNLGAKRSAIIPLFKAPVGDPQVILFYKERDDPQRPFRAVRFKNQATHSLGRGLCEVFLDGDFQGKCVLEPTKPGGELLLVHAKETGVRVFKECSRPETRRLGVRISEGIGYCEELSRRETVYRVQNSHQEAFALEIEHPRDLPNSRLEVTVSSGNHEESDIPDGQRIRTILQAGGNLQVNVKEERVEEVHVGLSASWLQTDVIGLKAPSSGDEAVEGCIRLQKEVDRLQAEIKERQADAATITQEQVRLIELIPHGHGEQANAWRNDLADAEKQLREIKRSTIPTLKSQLRKSMEARNEAFAGLRYHWSEAPRAGS
ncbi:hypothetical protein EP7_000353 [Isosphaeraceae bacterium EP7]